VNGAGSDIGVADVVIVTEKHGSQWEPGINRTKEQPAETTKTDHSVAGQRLSVKPALSRRLPFRALTSCNDCFAKQSSSRMLVRIASDWAYGPIVSNTRTWRDWHRPQ
jgi:hypothetical protein